MKRNETKRKETRRTENFLFSLVSPYIERNIRQLIPRPILSLSFFFSSLNLIIIPFERMKLKSGGFDGMQRKWTMRGETILLFLFFSVFFSGGPKTCREASRDLLQPRETDRPTSSPSETRHLPVAARNVSRTISRIYLSLSLSLFLSRCEHRRSIFHRVTRATVARKAILRWRNTPFACVRGERERERERE